MTLHWDIEPNTPEWDTERRENIGGSESPVLFGCGEPYHPSLFSLYAWKAGLAPEPTMDDRPGTRIWMGKQLEPLIAKLAAEINGWTIRPGPYAVDDECEGMAASLDFQIDEPGPEELALDYTGPGVLEIKNVDVFIHREKWLDDQPTDPVMIQMQHEAAAGNYGWGAIVGFVGGNDIRTYRYRASPKMAWSIRDKVGDFWRRVATGDAPPVDGDPATGRVIDSMFEPRGQHGTLTLGTDDDNLAAVSFMLAQAHKEESDRRYNEAENELKLRLAGAVRARTSDYQIVTRRKRLVVYPRKKEPNQ